MNLRKYSALTRSGMMVSLQFRLVTFVTFIGNPMESHICFIGD